MIQKIAYRAKLLRQKVNNYLTSKMIPSGFYIKQKGFCHCCDQDVFFESKNHWLRDNLRCSNCNSIPRERALMFSLERNFPNWRNLVIHESSPGSRGASFKLKTECKQYVSSHYFPGKPFGTQIQNHQNEDLANQTFADESFDLVITQDVMEHVFDPQKAFSEIARTLKKGGAHVFTVPLLNRHQPTAVWAVKDENGKVKFLHEEEYHQNPIDGKGSPVTYRWGFDIVDYIKENGNLNTDIEHFYIMNLGIAAEYNEVFISRKS